MCLGLIWEPDSPKVPIGRSSQDRPTPAGLVDWQYESVVFSEHAADAGTAEVRGMGGPGRFDGRLPKAERRAAPAGSRHVGLLPWAGPDPDPMCPETFAYLPMPFAMACPPEMPGSAPLRRFPMLLAASWC